MINTALIGGLQIFSLLLLYESIQRKKIPFVLFSITVIILSQVALLPQPEKHWAYDFGIFLGCLLLSGFLLTDVFPVPKSAFFWWLAGVFVVLDTLLVLYQPTMLWMHHTFWVIGALLLLDGMLLALGWGHPFQRKHLLFYLAAFCLAAMGVLISFFSNKHDGFLVFWHLASFSLYMALRHEPDRIPDELLDVLPSAWVIVNSQGKILRANQHACQILNVPWRQITGQSIGMYLPDWHRLLDTEVYTEYEIQNLQNLEQKRILQVYRLTDSNLLLQILEGKPAEKTILAHQQKRRLYFERLFILSDLLRDSDSIERYLEAVLAQLCAWYNAKSGVVYLNQNLVDEFLPSALVLIASFPTPGENFPASLPEMDGELSALLQHSNAFFISQETLKTFGFARVNQQENVLLLPLVKGQQRMGGIFLFFQEEISPETLVFLEQMSARIAQLLLWNQQQQRWGALRERQRLMENLHDGVMQHFYAAALYTDSIAAAVQSGNQAAIPDLLKKLQDALRQSVRDIRLILYELDKRQIEKMGLQKAIMRRLEKVELAISGMAVMADLDESIAIPPKCEKALYYIAMEALNNALRHAQASRLMIRLYRGKSAIILRVRDNGRGFRDIRKGLGFYTMQERARLLGGNLWIYSTPGKGTTLIAAMPLACNKEAPARRQT